MPTNGPLVYDSKLSASGSGVNGRGLGHRSAALIAHTNGASLSAHSDGPMGQAPFVPEISSAIAHRSAV